MSHRQARRHHREERHLCPSCRERKAKYQYRGHVRADRTHVLCFQCFRSERERMRARQLSQLPFESEPLRLRASARLGASASSASRTPVFNARQIEHRQRMLDFLTSQEVQRCAQR
jgi:hypothetical protein